MKRHSKAKEFNYILKLQCDTEMSSAVMLSWFNPTAPVCNQQHHLPFIHRALLHSTNKPNATSSGGHLGFCTWVRFTERLRRQKKTLEWQGLTDPMCWPHFHEGVYLLPVQGWSCSCWSGGGCAKLPVLLCICLAWQKHPECDNLHPELHRIMKYPLLNLTALFQPGGEKALRRPQWSLKEGYKKEKKSGFTLIDGDRTREIGFKLKIREI